MIVKATKGLKNIMNLGAAAIRLQNSFASEWICELCRKRGTGDGVTISINV